MPRVVPSQVVALITQMFGFLDTHDGRHNEFPLDLHSLDRVAALVDVVDQIPPHLITVEGELYAGYVAGLAALRANIPAWQAGSRIHSVSVISGFGNGTIHATGLIRRALAQCPDEAPSPTTTALAFITDAALRDSIRSDISAAHNDLRQGEWKGATVLAGSAVEALLLWAIQRHETQNPGSRAPAIAALRVGNNPLTREPAANIENWDLHEFTEVAARLGLITADTATQVRLARRFRNLIHPGLAQRTAQKCDIATAHGAIAAVEAVARDLTPP
jgi:hypothetical protein